MGCHARLMLVLEATGNMLAAAPTSAGGLSNSKHERGIR